MNILSSTAVVFLLSLTLGIAFVEGYCGNREFTCEDNGNCIPLIWRCDEHQDCADGSDEVACPPKSCAEPTEFRCRNETGCIPVRWMCDGDADCRDGSDEEPATCEGKTCAPEQFSCGLGQPCIPRAWHCDTHEDCPNGNDEVGCASRSCLAEEFQCNNGQCITMRWRCDGDNDCDGSDEQDCGAPTCAPGEFLCVNSSHCVPEAWRCDGDVDCADGSDENQCTSSPSINHICSTSTEFMCANYECIHKAWRCDGESDCVDHSDELDCHVTCRADQFTCETGNQCLPGYRECDGVTDCQDGSDENDRCPPKTRACTDSEFDCARDGTNCIAMSLVCNGQNDCGSGEDEGSLCNKPNPCLDNNGGCAHNCTDTHRGAQCSCRTGYKLTADQKGCEDVDECQEEGMCSQLCRNLVGSFRCLCHQGYMRDPHNHRFCKVEGDEPQLLFSNRYDMRRMGLHTGTYKPVLEKLKAAIGLDFDFKGDKVYYTDVALEQIMEADMISGNVNTSSILVKNSVNTPDGLALDWVHGNLYWTDTGMDTIEVLTLLNKNRKTLFNTGLDEPRAIVVDPRDNQGWIYWTDWGSVPKIERAGMDGSRRSAIISGDVLWPNGLTIDYVLERLFWVDAKLHTIGSSNLEGTDRKVILSSGQYLKHPFAITVFEDWLYWTDWETESIHSVRKFMNSTHPNQVSNKVLGLQSPMDVRVFHSLKQPNAPNRCGTNNGGCSHLCLPTPQFSVKSASFSCVCPNNMKLNDDGHTCLAPVTILPPSSVSSTASVNKPTPESVTKPIHESVTKSIPSDGEVAAIVVGIMSALVLVAALIGFFVYRSLMSRNIKCLNFDNPVYRKTTEDTFSLEKNQYQPSRTLPPTLEPLTAGTNEYV